jgi:hypothetical protein
MPAPARFRWPLTRRRPRCRRRSRARFARSVRAWRRVRGQAGVAHANQPFGRIGSDLATKHANDCRAILNADWFRRTFPATRISRTKNTESEVLTTQNGYRLATSIDGTLTGRGGDIIVIDDPLKPSDALADSKRERVNDWYNNTLLSRLDDKQRGLKQRLRRLINAIALVAPRAGARIETQLRPPSAFPASCDSHWHATRRPERNSKSRLGNVV